MSKKKVIMFACMFLFYYILNYLTPMAFGDDYVYSFIWQGKSEYEPLVEPVVRVSSFHGLADSLWLHYFTWSGRTISHMLTQLFLWAGKYVFNIFNALISVLLVMEIYWCANKGVVTSNFKQGKICWIFFALWAFTPGFSPVYFWLTGACNYLWTAVFLLAFLLPYIRKYYNFEVKIGERNFNKVTIFLLGVLAGWSNENSVCWIIGVLTVFLLVNRNNEGYEKWMLLGLLGLIIGYSLLMLAPGNVVRMKAEVGSTWSWVKYEVIKEKLAMLFTVFFFHFLLWYFNLRSIFILKKEAVNNDALRKERDLVKILCSLSFCMTTIMILSPGFPPRSAFPGTVQLIIATCILLRLQKDFNINIINLKAEKFLTVIGFSYFIVTATATLYGFANYYVQIEKILCDVVHFEQAKYEIITIHRIVPVSKTFANVTGQHMPYYEMSENENDWRNIAFARYYGIKGVRMIKSDKEKEDCDKEK